jgi:hypothetical protein
MLVHLLRSAKQARKYQHRLAVYYSSEPPNVFVGSTTVLAVHGSFSFFRFQYEYVCVVVAYQLLI